MTIFKNRPAAFSAAVFVMTSVLLISSSPRYKPIIAVTALSAAALYSAFLFVNRKKQSKQIKKLAIGFILASLGIAIAALYLRFTVDKQLRTAESLVGTDAEIEAVITEIKSETVYSGAYVVDIESADGENLILSARLETEFSADLAVGDVVRARVRFDELTDDGAYDMKTNGFRRGITVLAIVEDSENIELISHRDGVLSLIEGLRKRIAAVLTVSAELSGGDYGLASTLFVADKTELDGIVRRDFVYVGISHLLAVSGMHLSIIIGGLEQILKKLTLHKTPRTLVLISATVLYMGLTGFSASVLRAGFMLILYQLSYFFGREADRVTALFVSVAVIILVSPFSASDVGLLLSFSAMLACITATETSPKRLASALSRFAAKGKAAKLISDAIKLIILNLTMSFYAIIFTLPVMWLNFGRISLLAPIGTLAMFIPITLILYLAPFAVISFRLPWLWTVFAYPCSWLCRLSAKLVSVIAKIDGAEMLLPVSDAVSAIVLTMIVICITLVLTLPKRYGAAAGCIAVAVFLALSASSIHYRLTYDKNTVFYLNNNKNEGFVIADGASSLVVDISNGGSYITSASVEIAREELRSDVDAYMLTHLHRRHVTTVKKLLESEYLSRIYIPSPADEDETAVYNDLVALAKTHGVSVVEYVCGNEIRYGDVVIDIASAKIKRSTHPTLILAVESEGARTAYVGSSVHESEIFELALDICRNSERLIFGIHGPVVKGGADYFVTKDQTVVYANDEIEDFFSEYPAREITD